MSSLSSTAMLMLLAATVSAAGQVNAATNAVEPTGIYKANAGIGQWINPNAFVGIFFTLIFFWVCYCVLQATAAIQTPKIMLEKTLDWGKVEKTED